MKRSRFKEEQVIAILREQEAGSPTADVCRKHGISNGTFLQLTHTGFPTTFSGISCRRHAAPQLNPDQSPLPHRDQIVVVDPIADRFWVHLIYSGDLFDGELLKAAKVRFFSFD